MTTNKTPTPIQLIPAEDWGFPEFGRPAQPIVAWALMSDGSVKPLVIDRTGKVTASARTDATRFDPTPTNQR